jgi:hypothetical protein
MDIKKLKALIQGKNNYGGFMPLVDHVLAAKAGQFGAIRVVRFMGGGVAIYSNRRLIVKVTKEGGGFSVKTPSPAEAEAAFAEAKAEAKAEAERLKKARAMLEAALCAYRIQVREDRWGQSMPAGLPPRWHFSDGQKGGVFSHPDYGVVPARSVLMRHRARGIASAIEAEWDRALYGARY